MICNTCGSEIDGDDLDNQCPMCGNYDIGGGFIQCDYCGTLCDEDGYEWICPFCSNEGIAQAPQGFCECPSCGAVMDGDYCDECGWPDVNQGWLGENY